MYKISEVARLTKLSTATLRYYEAIGLLLPERQENTYRTFDDDDLTWLTLLKI